MSSARVFLTGFRPSISTLRDELAEQPGVLVSGAAGTMSESTRRLRLDEPDVVLHTVFGRAMLAEEIDSIRSVTQAPIVLLAEDEDPTLLDDALETDVADVVVLPQTAERVAFTIRNVSRRVVPNGAAPRSRSARVITVFSPKGGTGKTVISTHLATALAKHQKARTLLVDLDLQFGDAAIMLGLEPEQTLHELATGPASLDSDKLSGYLTRHAASGLDVLAAPLRPEHGELVGDETIEHLLEVAGPLYDAIVVDTSPSFHGPMLSALDRSDVLLFVCTPEVPTIKNVRLGIETLRLLSFPEDRMRLVLNRSDAGAGLRRPDVEAALGMQISYELPSAPDVPAAVNRGIPMTVAAVGAPFARSVLAMSASLLSTTSAGPAWSDRYSVNEAPRGGLGAAVRQLAGAWRPRPAGNSA
jgi:pilus assembly protein CpaE